MWFDSTILLLSNNVKSVNNTPSNTNLLGIRNLANMGLKCSIMSLNFVPWSNKAVRSIKKNNLSLVNTHDC